MQTAIPLIAARVLIGFGGGIISFTVSPFVVYPSCFWLISEEVSLGVLTFSSHGPYCLSIVQVILVCCNLQVPMYIGEIAPKHLRGSLGTMNQVLTVLDCSSAPRTPSSCISLVALDFFATAGHTVLHLL